MEQSVLAPFLVACAVLLVSVGMALRVATRAHEARLRHFVGDFRGDGPPVGEESRANWREELTIRLNRALARRDFVQAARLDLQRAGLQVKPTQFFVFRVLLALGGALLLALLLAGQSPLVHLAGMFGGLAGGFLLVRPFLGFKQQKRLNAFEKQFADALDVMVGGLESGASLTAAVEMVSREMPAPISTEFARALRDASLGVSYEDAFTGMHERLPSDDLGMFVSALSVQFRVGGNLAKVLRTLGETVRDRIRIRGEIKTLTAQQQMSGYIITAMPFFLVGFMLLTSRSYIIQIFQPGLARTLAMIGVVLVCIGNMVMRKILKIEV